ncbi:AAA family ATPase [Paenimyroides aestuarii]|uniref:AAA family ATPase n=1 Tax=Paenimyroides aestuarii TaxID=2968490 RepID=A0ABY5NT30_9FLAO|nr:AAA family ATPase [Paenimyroides aestuarii]UUV21730.1 AAA family ATPase [Paenimyroides aestuarii]
MVRKKINPNRDRDFVNGLDLTKEKVYPKFLKTIELEPFRHIKSLKVNFNHPISVISGTNRSGKSTILMAIACSHFNFIKRNSQNGNLERHTWGSLMQFTNRDIQTEDWTYHITYKLGDKTERKRGQRKKTTKKWNGIGKKESQFDFRDVVFIDLDRISPARNFSKVIYNKSKKSIGTQISPSNSALIEEYISYILEETFTLNKLATYQDKDIFKYKNVNEYSSYNAATGEEVLAKIIIDIVEAKKDSLILIDEIEVGLHPKVQRKLIEVLYNISQNDNKQFILTSHSQTILSSLPDISRVFLEKDYHGNFKCIQNISVNAALSKMDSQSYPLIDLYCEDDIAKKIISKILQNLQTTHNLTNVKNLVNIIVSGSAEKTHNYFIVHKETYDYKKIKTGFACILDGDMRNNYALDDNLHFLYSSKSPEYFLTKEYLNVNPNSTLDYHLKNSDNHCLFDKMNELNIGNTKDEVFELCWSVFKDTPDGIIYINELENFIIQMLQKYSPHL